MHSSGADAVVWHLLVETKNSCTLEAFATNLILFVLNLLAFDWLDDVLNCLLLLVVCCHLRQIVSCLFLSFKSSSSLPPMTGLLVINEFGSVIAS